MGYRSECACGRRGLGQGRRKRAYRNILDHDRGHQGGVHRDLPGSTYTEAAAASHATVLCLAGEATSEAATLVAAHTAASAPAAPAPRAAASAADALAADDPSGPPKRRSLRPCARSRRKGWPAQTMDHSCYMRLQRGTCGTGRECPPARVIRVAHGAQTSSKVSMPARGPPRVSDTRAGWG